MQTLAAAPSLSSTPPAACTAATPSAVASDADVRAAYSRDGGLECGDAVASMLRAHAAQPISLLARWIVARQIVTVPWRTQTLIPMFQFASGDMTVRDDVRQIVAELTPLLDDAQLARWFVAPNALLSGATPVQALPRDAAAVLGAACALRCSSRH